MLEHPVKKNDLVAMSGTRYGPYRILPVEKVSSHHVWVNDMKFGLNGTFSYSQGIELHHITPEIDCIVRQHKIVTYLTSFPWDRMDNDFLNDVADFMKSKGFNAFEVD